MIVHIRDIYISEQLSRGSTAFIAGLYINNVKVGTAENRGLGGPNTYSWVDEAGRKWIKEAEEWCATQPPMVNEDIILERTPITIAMTLELYIANLLVEHIRKMELRRIALQMAKDMAESILIGPDDRNYRQIRLKVPIESVLRREGGLRILRSLIQTRVLPALGEGDRILNSNIPSEFLEQLGIPEDKIVSQPSMISQEKNRIIKERKNRKLGGGAKGMS